MYLDQLKIQRFRSCAEVSVPLREDLTVLVGRTTAGKSNIVDAIRILTLPLNGRAERYAEDDDLRTGSTDRSFTIEGRFCGLSDALTGLLISAVPDPCTNVANWGLRYQCETLKTRGRTSVWAGRFDTAEPERGDAPGSPCLLTPASRRAAGPGSWSAHPNCRAPKKLPA